MSRLIGDFWLEKLPEPWRSPSFVTFKFVCSTTKQYRPVSDTPVQFNAFPTSIRSTPVQRPFFVRFKIMAKTAQKASTKGGYLCKQARSNFCYVCGKYVFKKRQVAFSADLKVKYKKIYHVNNLKNINASFAGQSAIYPLVFLACLWLARLLSTVFLTPNLLSLSLDSTGGCLCQMCAISLKSEKKRFVQPTVWHRPEDKNHSDCYICKIAERYPARVM